MGVVGGPASTFNPYLYVRGDPVNLTDPSGHIAPLVAAGLAALSCAEQIVDHIGQPVVDIVNHLWNRHRLVGGDD